MHTHCIYITDISDGGDEFLLDVVLRDVENFRRVDGAVVVTVDDIETVGEGRNVEHVEKGGRGLANLVASSNEVDGGGDFDVTTGDLRWHGKGLTQSSQNCLRLLF